MKKFFALMILSNLAAVVALAAPVAQSANYVCSRLNPDSAKDQCYGLVDRYGQFDQYAAGECDRYTDSWQTLECMRTIAGQWFSLAGVTECDRYTDANQTTQCLGAIAGRHLDDAAVAACSRITDANETTACLSAIAGKHFRDWEIARCDSYTGSAETIRCFRDLGW